MTRSRCPWMMLAIVLSLIWTASPSSVAAQGDPRAEARAHYSSGRQKYDAGDFRGAIAEFSAAENLAPAAVNDFNLGLSYERLGEREQAIRHYRAYLDRMPNAPNRAEVDAALARLDAEVKAAAAEASRIAEEEARAAEAARHAEEARRSAGPSGAPGSGGAAPIAYPATGDPELDRVAAIDLAPMRGPAAPAAAPAPPAEPAPPAKKSKAFYRSPVFWVVAAVCAYVVIVLATDSNDSSDETTTRLLPLPDGPSAPRGGGGGATVWRF